MDSLDATDRSLLQYASILGQTFTVGALAAVTGQTDDLEARLRTLVKRELLVLDMDPKSPERGQYGFVQGLVREVAYGTLTKRDRKVVHLAAGGYFESLDDEEIVDATAAHYLDAYRSAPEDDDAEPIRVHAADLLRRAAERATALGSHEQAVRFFELALEVTPGADQQSLLLRRAGEAARAAGRYEAADGYHRRAMATAREAGDKPSEALAIAGLGLLLASGAQPAAAIEEITSALPALSDLEHDASIVAVWAALSRAYMMHGDTTPAVEWADRALPLAERLDMVPEIADLLNTRATALGIGGRLRESIASLRGVLEMSISYGLSYAAFRARNKLGSVLWAEDPRGALRILSEGFEEAKRSGALEHMTSMGANIVDTAVHAGEWDRAEAIIADLSALELDSSDQAQNDVNHAVLNALRGRPYAEQLARVEAFAQTSDEPNVAATLHSLKGWVALVEGHFADACAEFSAAAATDGGWVTTESHGAARAALWAGDAAQARGAADLLRSVGSHGRGINAHVRVMDAGIAALSGQADEAAAGYRDAIRQWHDLEAWFDLALCQLDYVRFVGGNSPDVAAAATEAREIFTRLGAPAFLQRLEEAVAVPVA